MIRRTDRDLFVQVDEENKADQFPSVLLYNIGIGSQCRWFMCMYNPMN